MSMNIFDEYAGVFGELLPEERDELAKFATQLIIAKAAKDSARIDELLKEAASTLITNYDDFEAFAGLAEWLEKDASAAQVPAPSTNQKINLGNILAIIGMAGALVPPAVLGAKWAARKSAISKSKQQILKEYPSLREEPKFDQYFKMISDFAPGVAAQPLLAGNVLETLRRLGPAAITPQLINDLLGLQGRLGPSSHETLTGLTTGITRAAEIGVNRVGKNDEIRTKEKEMADAAMSRKEDLKAKKWFAEYERTQARQKNLGDAPLKPGSLA